MRWSYSVNIACPRCLSPGPAYYYTHACLPLCPLLGCLGVTLPSGGFSLLLHDGTRSGFEATHSLEGERKSGSRDTGWKNLECSWAARAFFIFV